VNQHAIEIPAYPSLFAAVFTITKLWNQPRCTTTNEWIRKYDILYIHIYAISLSHKEK
jgi:hypothetical protein